MGKLKNKAKVFFRGMINNEYTLGVPKVPYHDDHYIVAFPKSGISWLRFLLSNIIISENNLYKHVNFINVNDIIPDIHVSRNIPTQALQMPGHRLIKSHSTYNPLYKKVVYLYRNPQNVMMSYYRMWIGLNRFDDSYFNFVTNKKLGIDAWAAHVKGWLYQSHNNQRMIFLSYEDLLKDTQVELTYLTERMGWILPTNTINLAVERSSKDRMMVMENDRSMNDLRRRYNINRKESYRFVGNETPISNTELADANGLIWEKAKDVINLLYANPLDGRSNT
jgi:hypothetical protein